MEERMWMVAVIAAMALVMVVFATSRGRRKAAIRARHPGYPAGHFRGRGMAIGIALGAGIGTATKNVAAGIGAGVALGAAIGQQMETKHAHEIREAVPEEEALNRQTLFVMLGLLSLGLVTFLLVTFGAG